MRLDQLTFTRFVAAISIVIFHFGKAIYPFNTAYLGFLFKQANVGVSYFFILSGFIMIISYGKKERVNPLDYYKNRFARIYPIYLLGLLIYLPIRLMLFPADIIFFFHASMLQAWFPGWVMGYNFPGWSVSVELFFYLIFPFLFNYIYTKTKYAKVYFSSILVFWILSQFVFLYFLKSPFYKGENTPSHELLFYFPVMHLNEFLIGNLAGIFCLKNSHKFQKKYDYLIVVLIALIVVALKFPIGLNYEDGLLSVVFVPLIVFLSFNTGVITKIFKTKFLVFLGEISYGLYIYQLPIFYYLKKMPLENQVLAFFVKITVLILLSSLSFIYIETPLRDKIKKINLRFN